MIESYLSSWKNYANFNGRTSRSDYWKAFLVNTLIWVGIEILIIITSVLTTISGLFNIAFFVVYALSIIYSLAYFIPSLSIIVRRLHDQDKSGALILLELIPFAGIIVILIFMCSEGIYGDNRFGKDPRSNRGGVN